MPYHARVAVIGAGQSGLATSCWLTEDAIDHVLPDRGRGLHTLGSSLYWGVGKDTEFIAGHIAGRG